MDYILEEEAPTQDRIGLDAEELAEGGVAEAYEELDSSLRELGITPRKLTEIGPQIDGTYAVECHGVTYRISGDDVDEADTWEQATFALFDVVNRQLVDAGLPTRMYAFHSGNELEAVFLTQDEAAVARKAMANPDARPYLPTAQA